MSAEPRYRASLRTSFRWFASCALVLFLGGFMWPGQASAQSVGTAEAVGQPAPHPWEEDIRKFEAIDAQIPPPSHPVVFVGSSSIRFWNLPSSFPELKALNRGFGGSQMSDIVEYAQRIVVHYQPRVVVVYSGDNDLADKSAQRIRDDFVAFSKTVLNALPQTRIVIISVKPSPSRWPLIEKLREANRLLEQAARDQPRTTFLDIATAMLDAQGRPRLEFYVNDGLHMTPAGYALWSTRLKPLL